MDCLMGYGTQHEEDAIVPRVKSCMTTCRRVVDPDYFCHLCFGTAISLIGCAVCWDGKPSTLKHGTKPSPPRSPSSGIASGSSYPVLARNEVRYTALARNEGMDPCSSPYIISKDTLVSIFVPFRIPRQLEESFDCRTQRFTGGFTGYKRVSQRVFSGPPNSDSLNPDR